MRTLIVTVGTSLLTNRTDERPWHGWQHGQDLPDENTAAQYAESADEQLLCAETNTLQALPNSLQPQDSIAFLHSATPAGEWCAKVLLQHYQKQGHKCELFEIGGLSYKEKSFTSRGLKSLMEHIFSIIKQADNVAICATGGFKAEIAFANMIGMLTHVPVYYLHEQFRELVELPSIPIDWDISIVEDNRRFFEWIDEEPRSSLEVENWLKANPQLRTFTSVTLDGHTLLSTVGELIYGAYKIQDNSKPKAVWPPPSEVSPQEKIKLEGTDHHRPKGWKDFTERIAEIAQVGIIRYDGNGDKSKKRSGVYDSDSDTGTLKVLLADEKYALPLVVETTARGEEQVDLVKEYLQRQIRNW